MDLDGSGEPPRKRPRGRPRKLGLPASSTAGGAIVSVGNAIGSRQNTETQHIAGLVGGRDYEFHHALIEYDRGVHVSESAWKTALGNHHREADVCDPSSSSISTPYQSHHAAVSAGHAPSRPSGPEQRAAGSIFDVGLSHWIDQAKSGVVVGRGLQATSSDMDTALTGKAPSHGGPYDLSKLGGFARQMPHAFSTNRAAIPESQPPGDNIFASDEASSVATKSAKKAKTVRVTKAGQSLVAAYAAKKLQLDVSDLPSGSRMSFPKAMELDGAALSEHDRRFGEYSEQLAKHRQATKMLLGSESSWLDDAPVVDPASQFILD
ncbi:hypothetical protein LTR85_005026 [Meristemomyces frigidus]|nr:hypothetical protein LTR85_005026 [Meristemomyces frigidus]